MMTHETYNVAVQHAKLLALCAVASGFIGGAILGWLARSHWKFTKANDSTREPR